MSEVLLDIGDGIARLRFNRPARLNTANVALAEGFAAAAETALADPSVRVVLLTGEGRAFMAGGDLAGFRAAGDRPGTPPSTWPMRGWAWCPTAAGPGPCRGWSGCAGR